MTVSSTSNAPPPSASVDSLDDDIDPATGLPYGTPTPQSQQPVSLATQPDTSSTFAASTTSRNVTSTARPPTSLSAMPPNAPQTLTQAAGEKAHHHHHGGGHHKTTDDAPPSATPLK